MVKRLDGKGIWIAKPGKDEFYSPGEVFITVREDLKEEIPEFLGGGTPKKKEIFNDNAGDLMRLIHRISQTMVEVLKCERVYLVSLGENTEMGIHFRLLPRYESDKGFLDDFDPDINETNDGLSLMAHWRKQFLLKSRATNHEPHIKLLLKHKEAIEQLRDALSKK